MERRITVIGVGLIGGSFALAMRDHDLADHVVGVSPDPESGKKALALGLVDEILPLKEAVKDSLLIYVAIPVNAIPEVVEEVLNLIDDDQVVLDAGSTKAALCREIAGHPRRNRFVATHPMWGTEHSGPEAAVYGAFAGRACVICESEKSDEEAFSKVADVYRRFGMHLVLMDPEEHDMHAAYVSHISHVTSFALANTVLAKEKEKETIFALAGGGFESTVRLAKSNPAMWAPIFLENKAHVLDVLQAHMVELESFRNILESNNTHELCRWMERANQIKKILK